MTSEINTLFPPSYYAIDTATKASGFTMASDALTCSLLRTLATSKPCGRFLELGRQAPAFPHRWILDGMDNDSTLISVDHDPLFLGIAKQFLGNDKRLELIESDGEVWINHNNDKRFDYIFADTWHGKYLMLNEALSMLNKGGIYIIDDMLPQPNWPEGHDAKAISLIAHLETRKDIQLTKQVWATGIILVVKK